MSKDYDWPRLARSRYNLQLPILISLLQQLINEPRKYETRVKVIKEKYTKYHFQQDIGQRRLYENPSALPFGLRYHNVYKFSDPSATKDRHLPDNIITCQ